MTNEKAYKLFALVPVLIGGLYLSLFLYQTQEWGQRSTWGDRAGLFFWPFVLLSIGLGILGIGLAYKAKKEKRKQVGLWLATICYFSGFYLVIGMIVIFIFGIFQIEVFQGVINRK